MSSSNRDRLTVIRDGEEQEVFNHVSISQHHYVNAVNGYETFEADIGQGDMGGGPAPEAVTERVARLLDNEFSIDVTDHDIEVIDVADDDVEVI